MPLPNKQSGAGGSGPKKWTLPKISLTEKSTPLSIRPFSRPSKPTRPLPSKPEDLSLFKKTPYVAPKTLSKALWKDPEFLKVARGSASKAKEIIGGIGESFPKGGSITKDWARRKAKELDRAYQFPYSDPKNPKSLEERRINRGIRDALRRHLGV